MLLRLSCFVRRLAGFAIPVAASCWVAIPFTVGAQGISLTGVAEGGMISLGPTATTTNLAITAIPSSPAGSTNVAFTLERQGSVLLTRTSPPPYAVTFSNLTAGKYFLTARLVAAGSPPSGDVSFDIKTASLQPPNDNWTNATSLSLGTTAASTNTYATSELNEPVHGGTSGKSLWWSWTAVSNGIFTATTIGSSFDTVLAVYRGTNLGTLVQMVQNDDAGPHPFSQVTFFATNGTVIYLAVDSATTVGSGKAQLRLIAGSPPAVSITAPTDGSLYLVSSPTAVTNAQAAAAISDPAGVARVDYWLDDGSGVSRSGILPAPYQLNLTNLLAGHYVLTLMASNNVGLIGLTNAGLSVISLAPVLVADGFVSASGAFRLGVTGFKGRNYTLQISTNLDVWCSATGWTNFAGAEKVTDTNAPLVNRRFYRASSP